jgi:hypothetical protein
MTARSAPSIDAMWHLERMSRYDDDKPRRGNDTPLGTVTGTTPATAEQRADAVWTVAGRVADADHLRLLAEAFGCDRADVGLGRARLLEAKAARAAA